jgi:mercuric ion transport protein
MFGSKDVRAAPSAQNRREAPPDAGLPSVAGRQAWGMSLAIRTADKAGVLGSVVSAMGCAACFPAIAGFGAAVGLAFLANYEGLLLGKLMPLFAGVALLANALGWFRHRQWQRSVLGMLGPAVVLTALFPLIGHWWTARLLYAGLALMVGVAVWDLLAPANRKCGPQSCELPQGQQPS